MTRFVLDASVPLSWCFPDEHSDLAQEVADRFQRGDTAVAPSFWPHEVLNALLAGEKRKRISLGLVRAFLRDLAVLPVELHSLSAATVFVRLESLSRKHNLTVYDAAYLDLAIENGLALATLDKQLAAACKDVKVGLLG